VADEVAFYSKMLGATADGETFYDAIKRGFWEFLQERGEVPGGTVE